MDYLKFHSGPPCLILLRPMGGRRAVHPWAYGRTLGVACSQGKRPAAVFYPFGHPLPHLERGVVKMAMVGFMCVKLYIGQNPAAIIDGLMPNNH
jgi:hypothetical protein